MITRAEWKARLQAIEEAIRRARPVERNLRFVNDPEDEDDPELRAFRAMAVDEGKTIEITQSAEWYEAYAAAVRAGDEARALELLEHGTAALGRPNGEWRQ
jgi:hypothetical protein